ncbi:TPA: hypothetical protein N0F65_000801 [Lagenidium giganteum]|uniref:Leucine-rich repeat domain, L domain-like n=1 Tax=Lagenidium giganteum TaxID=4803 RepID=A0AAV2ZCE3_9STRA|nr:TPA: hypothetical protein N0F65_000801 [Lagenidium giganteum]
MVRCSWQQGHLAFHVQHGNDTEPPSLPWQIMPLWSMYHCLFSEVGIFGVCHPWFETIFTVRETVEIVAQIYQAYWVTHAVSRAWINDLLVAIIIINCFSGIAIHLLLRHRTSAIVQRMTAVAFDFALDLTCAVIIPVVVLMPYVYDYDPGSRFFPFQLLMDDVWYTNAVAEAQQVLVTSWLDYVGTMLPHVSLLSCVSTIRETVRPERRENQYAVSEPLTPTSDESPGSSARVSSIRRQPQKNKAFIKLLHIICMLCGIAVLIVHAMAKSKTRVSVPGCRLHVSAWLATNYSCSVFTVNCYREGIDGQAETIAPILAQLEQSVLRILVVSHCPNVTVPSAIQLFPRLYGLEFYICSLTEWSATAAAHSAYHEQFHYLYFVHTKMTELPPGILHRNLPASLTSLGLFNTTLPGVPSTLPEYWREHTWDFFGIENSSLDEVPVSLGQLPIVHGLSGNNITSLPVDVFTQPEASGALQAISLSLNPLTTAPTLSSAEAQSLMVLYLESTLVRTVPEWMVAWMAACERGGLGCVGTLKYAPACEEAHGNSSVYSEFCDKDQLSCSGSYNMTVMEPQRPL